jgi:hypothetical protein
VIVEAAGSNALLVLISDEDILRRQ